MTDSTLGAELNEKMSEDVENDDDGDILSNEFGIADAGDVATKEVENADNGDKVTNTVKNDDEATNAVENAHEIDKVSKEVDNHDGVTVNKATDEELPATELMPQVDSMEGEELDYEAEVEREEEIIDTNQNQVPGTEATLEKSNGEEVHDGDGDKAPVTDDSGRWYKMVEEEEDAQKHGSDCTETVKDTAKTRYTNTVRSPSPPGPECVACQPCNLVFSNSKWLEKHTLAGDHNHVVKGYKPRGGKYLCLLCWLGFEQCDMLTHHIKLSEHITRCERKGVHDLLIRPGMPQPSWVEKLLTKPSSITSSTSRSKSKSHHQSLPVSNTWSNASNKHNNVSNKPNSTPSKSSKSPRTTSSVRVVRLSDYYEVSSVGHCDLGSGARPRTLHATNGMHEAGKRTKDGEANTPDQPSAKKVKSECTVTEESRVEGVATEEAQPVGNHNNPDISPLRKEKSDNAIGSCTGSEKAIVEVKDKINSKGQTEGNDSDRINSNNGLETSDIGMMTSSLPLNSKIPESDMKSLITTCDNKGDPTACDMESGVTESADKCDITACDTESEITASDKKGDEDIVQCEEVTRNEDSQVVDPVKQDDAINQAMEDIENS